MRIAVVYDCLFPYTVGGAERWYRNLALRLAADGHQVTFVTMRQWPAGTAPDLPGVRVVAVTPRMQLYAGPGRRRIAPPLAFGAAVLWHFLRHGRRYDVVHTASFPYFSLLAIALTRPGRLVVDWHELWSRAYWKEYLGRGGGWVGAAVQRLCLRVPHRAFCFARSTAARLHAADINAEVTVLEGEYAGPLEPAEPLPADPVVVFAGRHIPEKNAPAAVAGIAAARARSNDLRGVVFGDGPDRPQVLPDGVEAPGFVDRETLERTLARALCLLHPSRREGYGLVVVEAAALGVPVILVAHPDNAATELLEDGVNGVLAASASPDDLAEAILRVRTAGPLLRRSTSDWFARNARRLAIDGSLDAVSAAYR